MKQSDPVVVAVGSGRGSVDTIRTRQAVSAMLLVAGGAFALVGFVDVLLLWIPTDAGNVAWEYATVGRTLDSMPLSALGLLLVGYGVLRAPQPTPRSALIVTAIFVVYALFAAALGFLIFTSAPAVISQTPAAASDAVRRAATRHGIQGVIYPLAWATISVIVWRARGVGATR